MKKKQSGKAIDPALLEKVLGGEHGTIVPGGQAAAAKGDAIAQPAFGSFFHS